MFAHSVWCESLSLEQSQTVKPPTHPLSVSLIEMREDVLKINKSDSAFR